MTQAITRITTTTGRVLGLGEYHYYTDLQEWVKWARIEYWYAIGTGTINADIYARYQRLLQRMPTDTDIVNLQEWIENMPKDAKDIANRTIEEQLFRNK